MTKIFIFMSLSFYCFAQTSTSESLISVHNVDNVTTMNNISNPEKGHLIFVESTSTLYFYDGSAWVSTISSGGGGTADGDAWGVSGEDITNAISRSGKITSGTNSFLETFKVNGNVKITNLPTDLNLRSMGHESDGTLRTDVYHSYYHGTPSTTWENIMFPINVINKGFVITGRYFYDASPCSSPSQATGHFQFRYYHDSNSYQEVYNTGNAVFTTVNLGVFGTDIEYRFNTTHCGNQAGVSFRVNNTQFQTQANGSAYRLDIVIEGY